LCQKYRGYIGKSKGNTEPGNNHRSVDFQVMWKLVQPWTESSQPETEPEVKLKLIDVENETSRVCDLDEAKNWDWSNPEMMRLIGDLQVTSWEKLVEIVRFKAKKGHREVDIYVAPRFMLLGGGKSRWQRQFKTWKSCGIGQSKYRSLPEA